MSLPKHSEVSKFLRLSWNENDKTLDKHEENFMLAIKNILFWLSTEPDPKKAMDTVYDAPMLLKAIGDAIEEYKEIYHIVSVSMSWNNRDDEEQSDVTQ
jgi:hypothetical protein